MLPTWYQVDHFRQALARCLVTETFHVDYSSSTFSIGNRVCLGQTVLQGLVWLVSGCLDQVHHLAGGSSVKLGHNMVELCHLSCNIAQMELGFRLTKLDIWIGRPENRKFHGHGIHGFLVAAATSASLRGIRGIGSHVLDSRGHQYGGPLVEVPMYLIKDLS